MPADTLHTDFPYAADAIAHARAVINQTDEQKRAAWASTIVASADRRLLRGFGQQGAGRVARERQEVEGRDERD